MIRLMAVNYWSSSPLGKCDQRRLNKKSRDPSWAWAIANIKEFIVDSHNKAILLSEMYQRLDQSDNRSRLELAVITISSFKRFLCLAINTSRFRLVLDNMGSPMARGKQIRFNGEIKCIRNLAWRSESVHTLVPIVNRLIELSESNRRTSSKAETFAPTHCFWPSNHPF